MLIFDFMCFGKQSEKLRYSHAHQQHYQSYDHQYFQKGEAPYRVMRVEL
jgi:hypothetical protein